MAKATGQDNKDKTNQAHRHEEHNESASAQTFTIGSLMTFTVMAQEQQTRQKCLFRMTVHFHYDCSVHNYAMIHNKTLQ